MGSMTFGNMRQPSQCYSTFTTAGEVHGGAGGDNEETPVGSICLHDMANEPDVVDGDEARGTPAGAHSLDSPSPMPPLPYAPLPIAPCSLP